MKRILPIFLVSLVVLCRSLAQGAQLEAESPGAKPPDAMPTVDAILDRYVQALGGRETIEKLTSRVMKGTIDLPATGESGTMEVYRKAPNKRMYVTKIPSFEGVIQQGFNGTVGWSMHPWEGLRELSGAELASARRDADFFKELRLKDSFSRVTVVGKVKVGDREAYVIEASPSEGNPEKMYFDMETGLLLRSDVPVETPDGKSRIDSTFEDYREVDGMKISFTIRQTSPDFDFVIKFGEVKHNVPIDEAKFEKPAGQ